MEIVIKYAKESDDFRWESYTRLKKHISHLMQDSTCLFVDYVRAMYMRFKYHNLTPLASRPESTASEITNPVFLGIKTWTVAYSPLRKREQRSLLFATCHKYRKKIYFLPSLPVIKGKFNSLIFGLHGVAVAGKPSKNMNH